jgi:hypothetical protein
MAKTSKAGAKKRLEEAQRKIRRVMYGDWGTMNQRLDTITNPIWADLQKADKALTALLRKWR